MGDARRETRDVTYTRREIRDIRKTRDARRETSVVLIPTLFAARSSRPGSGEGPSRLSMVDFLIYTVIHMYVFS